MQRIIAGRRAVSEALRSAQADRLLVIYRDAAVRADEIEGLAQQRHVVVETVSATRLQSLAGTLRHQGIVAVAGEYGYVPFEEFFIEPNGAVLLALDEVVDPHNLGAMIRSAVAFGIAGIVLPRHRAAHVTGAVVRSSAGATEHARISVVGNLARALRQLRQLGWEILGLAAEGELPLARVVTGRVTGEEPVSRVLVVGSEGRGLRHLVRQHCDGLVRIPLRGPVASLNASVAASVALYHLTQSDTEESEHD